MLEIMLKGLYDRIRDYVRDCDIGKYIVKFYCKNV